MTHGASALVITLLAAPIACQDTSTRARAAQPPVQSASGLPLITDRGPTTTERGWRIAYDSSSVTVANDPTGQPSLAMRFPAGFAGGASPATVFYEGFSVTKIRWEETLSYPIGYVKHRSNVDKSVFVQVNGQNLMFTMMYDQRRLIPSIGLQGIVNLGVSTNLTPNLRHAELTRGKRYVLACEATGNAAGMANGSVECWLDDVKFLSRSGIQFTPGAAHFTGVLWAPIWGGAGGRLASAQSVYLARLRVFGK